MELLTLNIIVSDRQQFMDENKSILEEIRKKENVIVNVASKTDGKYYAYEELLQKTQSLYVVFYDEHNQLNVEDINCLVDEIKLHTENVMIQRMSDKDKGDKTEYSIKSLKSPLYFNRYVFKTEYLKCIEIREKEYPFYEEKVILVALRELESIVMLKESKLITDTPMEKNVNLYSKQFDKEWYIPFFEDFVLPYVRENVLTPTEQRMIVYYILLRFYLNLNSRDKQVLQGEEVEYFFSLINKTVQHIDDIYLIEIRNGGLLPKFFPYLLLKGKYGNVDFSIEKQDGNLVYMVNGLEYAKNCVETRVAAINFENDKLIIDGELVGDYCFADVQKQFGVQVNGDKIEYVKTGRYNIAKAFGHSIYRYYPFQFEIHQNEMEKKTDIQFTVLIGNKWVKLPIQFDKLSSRLMRSKWSYYKFSDKIITFSNEVLHIKPASAIKIACYELGICAKTFVKTKKKKNAIKLVGLRGLYWLTKRRYSERPIWIFYDKLYKAGDNAEYLFRYCMENHPEADCYYILNKDANEYKRLKREYGKYIVVFESLRNKLAVLNAQYIFATHASVFGFCGFNKQLRNHFKNLLSADIVCIQHGLTIQNIAQYQNRLADNTKKYFCASKYEIDNLSRPVYDYQKESLCLTGSPRYDGLVNRDKKQILIAPTWRRNIVITGNKMGTAKSYNPDFKHTKYFEIYNSLINDKRLLTTAKKYGYSIVFLIHPTLSSQVEDYDTNEYLSIIPAVSDVSYEKMLTESSLMLTDYSGIQFDFAYMKKPILYYQPKELPPQYTEGVYQYDTMGFGPIIDEYEEIIKVLCKMIENGCKMESKYISRVEDFFEYTDHSNCKRIMEEMLGQEKE